MTGCWRPAVGQERRPDHLGAAFDWTSVPHADLFRMVHHGLNPEAGVSVAADWARLGEELTDIGDELAELANAAADAWQGEAADLVTTNVRALSRWARHAGDTATEVAGCVTVQVDNAARARDAMPPPVHLTPAPMPTDAGVAHTFTGGGFESASNLLLDQQADVLDRMHTRHAEAARVMDQFQVASREIYRTVPRFSTPATAGRGKERAHGRRDAPTAPVPSPSAGSSPPTTPAGGGSGAAVVDGAGGSGAGGASGSRGHGPAPGSGVTAGPDSGGGARAVPAPPAPAPAPGVGALPMGGAAGAGRGEDREHRRLGYLEEVGFWESTEGELCVSAAVIGELPGHG